MPNSIRVLNSLDCKTIINVCKCFVVFTRLMSDLAKPVIHCLLIFVNTYCVGSSSFHVYACICCRSVNATHGNLLKALANKYNCQMLSIAIFFYSKISLAILLNFLDFRNKKIKISVIARERDRNIKINLSDFILIFSWHEVLSSAGRLVTGWGASSGGGEITNLTLTSSILELEARNFTW